MTNIERHNELSASCGIALEDVYTDGRWSISKQWLTDGNKKRIPHTIVFMVYEDDEGDCPPFATLREAKEYLRQITKDS